MQRCPLAVAIFVWHINSFCYNAACMDSVFLKAEVAQHRILLSSVVWMIYFLSIITVIVPNRETILNNAGCVFRKNCFHMRCLFPEVYLNTITFSINTDTIPFWNFSVFIWSSDMLLKRDRLWIMVFHCFKMYIRTYLYVAIIYILYVCLLCIWYRNIG